MGTLQLSPKLLEWAAAQVGSTAGDIAHRISSSSADEILKGGMTESQAIKFANIARVPLGFLFLKEAPKSRKAPIADFRTQSVSSLLDQDFFDIYDDVVLKQAWYRDYLLELGAKPLDFVGRFSNGKAGVKIVAADIASTLRIRPEDTRKIRTPEAHFSYLANLSEAAGINVLKNGVVGFNNSRPLSVGQFRGFVLSDSYAPFVFVNGSDYSAAWVFTLVHELAHIWSGESGISDAKRETSVPSERRCNQVAAELLMPEEFFRECWAKSGGDPLRSVGIAEKTFQVSGLAVATRGQELGLLSQSDFAKVLSRSKSASGGESSGGDFYASAAVKNGRAFSKTVASLAMSGQMSFREAGRLLNLNPNKVSAFHERRS